LSSVPATALVQPACAAHAEGQPLGRRAASKASIRVRLYSAYLAIDLAAIAVAVTLASVARFGLGSDGGWAYDIGVLLLPIYALLGVNFGAFQVQTLVSTTYSIRRGLTAFAGALVTAVILLYLLKFSEDYSRLAFSYLAIVGTATVAAGRFASRRLARRWLQDRVETSVLLQDAVHRPETDADSVVDAQLTGLRPDLRDPQMLNRLGHVLHGVDRVIVACPPERRRAWAAALKGAGVTAELLMPEMDLLGAIGTGHHAGAATIVVGRGPLGTRDRMVKRAFDLACVVAALPVVLLVSVAVAVAVKLESRGPVLFAQIRVGQGNRHFRMLKFRSMRVELNDPDGRVSTLRTDHRITRVGRFIRATSLDELPQLWNVFKGEMSIVGPRPHALGSTAEDRLFWEIDERYWHRHAAKPGLTGLAQVRGHRGATETRGALVDRIQSDLEYLNDWSIWRDVRILAGTVGVLLHKNAY